MARGWSRNGFFKPIYPAFPGAGLRTRRSSSTAFYTSPETIIRHGPLMAGRVAPSGVIAAGCLPILSHRYVVDQLIVDLVSSAIGCTWVRLTHTSWPSTGRLAKSYGT